jgi:hypothetical protein
MISDYAIYVTAAAITLVVTAGGIASATPRKLKRKPRVPFKESYSKYKGGK